MWHTDATLSCVFDLYAQKEAKAQEAEGAVVDDLRKQNETLQEQLAQLTGVIAGLTDTIQDMNGGGGKGASKKGGKGRRKK